jgi:hypothetical protein
MIKQTSISPSTRELDRRNSDGIEVALLWNPRADQVLISVTDTRRGGTLEFEVAPRYALEAFHHPFAFAPPGCNGTAVAA